MSARSRRRASARRALVRLWGCVTRWHDSRVDAEERDDLRRWLYNAPEAAHLRRSLRRRGVCRQDLDRMSEGELRSVVRSVVPTTGPVF